MQISDSLFLISDCVHRTILPLAVVTTSEARESSFFRYMRQFNQAFAKRNAVRSVLSLTQFVLAKDQKIATAGCACLAMTGSFDGMEGVAK